MNDLAILLLAIGIPAGILLVWYAVREFQCRLRWRRMWADMVDITDMDEGRERWHRFLKEGGKGHKIALPKTEGIFQGIWRGTRNEKENCKN